jgi:NhaP-type Na+/H+ and K+/H+ antiporter
VVGTRVRDLGLPESALVILLVRDGQGIPPRGQTTIEAGDRMFVLARAKDRTRVEALLERWETPPAPGETVTAEAKASESTSTVGDAEVD